MRTIKRTCADPMFSRQLFAVYGHDLQSAAHGLGVSVKTIKRYLKDGCNNEPLRRLLYIQFRGYLPDCKIWESWRCSEQGLHSPDGKIYRPATLNAWNLEKTEHMFNKWFIQDLKSLGLYDDLRQRVNAYHQQPAATIAQ